MSSTAHVINTKNIGYRWADNSVSFCHDPALFVGFGNPSRRIADKGRWVPAKIIQRVRHGIFELTSGACTSP